MYKIYSRTGLINFVKANKSELETLLAECRAFFILREREGKTGNEAVRFMSNHGKMDCLRKLVANGLEHVKKLPCYKRDVALLRAMYIIEAECRGDMQKPKTRPFFRVHDVCLNTL